MANVSAAERGKTRSKLAQAATELFYEQGVSNTTLADIAAASGVPLGNVYYHFKTKDELIGAVVEARVRELKQLFEAADCGATPRAKLQALLGDGRTHSDVLVHHGCPYASLIHDLDKLGSAQDAGKLLQLYLGYAEEQFSAMTGEDATALAAEFVSRLQGAYLLANALNSPALLSQQLDRLESWLETVSS